MQACLIFLILLPFSVCSQLKIVVTKIPDNTPPFDPIFIVGTFNNWQPGDSSYTLNRNNDGMYEITLKSNQREIEYKFVRSNSWSTVEGNDEGRDIPNRKAKISKSTIEVEIASWTDLMHTEPILSSSTKLQNVITLTDSFYIPQLNTFRRILVYLPPDYETSENTYPVLYMHDGQNLFDESTSFAGEWNVDETLNSIASKGIVVPIVVGIEHGGQSRIDEYSPFINPEYGGGKGDEYVDFIANTLKPYIDSIYRTKSGCENTGIMGSSMGGLISTYAALKYPKIFGKVGAYSPSYGFSDSINTYIANAKIGSSQKIYILVAKNELPYIAVEGKVKNLFEILVSSGFQPQNIKMKVAKKGEHNELFWRKEFEETFLWLFDAKF